MMQHIRNIFHLGVKELIELGRDGVMLVLILYTFTAGVYITAKGTPDAVQRGSIAIVDEDQTQLSQRIFDAFLPPMFLPAQKIRLEEVDPGMDRADYTFVLVIPSQFQHDVLTGKQPEIQLNVDATQMSMAFVGTGYIQQIVLSEIQNFVSQNGGDSDEPAKLVLRNRFNENLTASWFGGVNQMINYITMLAIVLIGAALIREREQGTLEHLLVMPVVPFEIMCAKIWSMLVVVLAASAMSVVIVMEGFLKMPIEGSLLLYFCGVALHLFAVISMGFALACVAQNMPQMGMLLLLVLMPMNMLSGGVTPMESMPQWAQIIMQAAPTTHFVSFSQQVLFRGAGLEVVWKPYLAIFIIGCVLFGFSLFKFKKSAT